MKRTLLQSTGREAQWVRILVIFLIAAHTRFAVGASNLDIIGVTLLRTVTTNLNGTGVRVAQPEAGAPDWEVNPGAVGQPLSLFTYYSSGGSDTNYPNSLGIHSDHADQVGGIFYGPSGGVATNVAHVDNYQADYFAFTVVPTLNAINDSIVNQSFTVGTNDPPLDQSYDNYAAANNTLFVTGAGFDNQPVYSPATCFNGIGVGVSDNAGTPYGPTPDGRSKPDIVAPGGATSYSTPLVTGATALLLQAGSRGDGGSDTNSAADIRTLKALLLNGAIKPADWTNSHSSPLDARYGAGVLNVFNSCEQLAGGKQTNFVAQSVSSGSPHPPAGVTNTVDVLSGWDFETISSSLLSDGVNHYYFNVTNGVRGANFTATATLVWNRQQNQTGINNLDLFLYDANSGIPITSSTSVVDNVEQIFVTRLPAGRYDLQVLKNGGLTVSPGETYALAFEFFSLPLSIARSGTNAALTWPIYPAGFGVESTPDLAPPITWSTLNATPSVTNNQNRLVLDASSGNQFFRLRRP